MQKALEILQRIITNDPILVLLIFFMIGLAISINSDFNKIITKHKQAIKIAESMDFTPLKKKGSRNKKRSRKEDREAMKLANELERLQKMRF